MLGSNNSARFQSSTLSSIQTLQTSIATTRNNLQQQISVLNGQISTINTRLNDDSQLVGGKVTLASLGLQNVNNTADTLKPISNATAAALDLKQNLLSLTNTLPVAHVTNLSTTLSDMNTLLLSKINSDALVFNNIKTSSNNSKSLTSTLSDINTSLNAKATTAALDLTNTQVGNKVNTADLLFANVKETSQTGARTLAAAISSIDGTLQTKANTNQLIYSQIKASTDANAETLTKTLSDMNTSIENKVNSNQLIFNNIKTSASDTTNLTLVLQDKANKTDLLFEKVTVSNTLGSLNLTSKFTLVESDIAKKADFVPAYAIKIYSASVGESLGLLTTDQLGKNKVIICGSSASGSITASLTVPNANTATNNYSVGDFYHFIARSAPSATMTVRLVFTLETSGFENSGAVVTSSHTTSSTSKLGIPLKIQVFLIDNIKTWVRVL